MKSMAVTSYELKWAFVLCAAPVALCLWVAIGVENSAAFWQITAVPILGQAIISFAVIGPPISVIAIWGRNPIIQSIFVAYYIVLLGIADFQPRPLEDASFGDQFVNVFRAAYYSLLVLFLLALFAAIARRREERSAMKLIILVVFIVLSATLALALPQML
ncbi:hypothetical protein ACQZ40_25535 [Agrobacterium sp. 16-172Ci]|uniref:Uncharacterized protein n=1 Tax=Agrobacterium tumefaciens TaxID=358 RepID=A0A2L2LH83_AGRTU|nr:MULTISPECIES: hypothetical protein [Agrobacterium]AVH43695.1 hypothetical protein At1D1609_36420 [Agrobacterium tumefaciens]MCZ4072841.1 hypothetical protein [Agrobacterium sp. LMR679]NSY97638.1 hypothetical protein [Agrobacterium tumefaciens]